MAYHPMTDAECDELLEQGSWAARNNLERPHPMQHEFDQWAAERERIAARKLVERPGLFRRIGWWFIDLVSGCVWA